VQRRLYQSHRVNLQQVATRYIAAYFRSSKAL
jgi:hypothetical protein